ncbi:CRISPR-associated endoribonuclease Cas6 [Dolosicoccus paucivorans]|uniref:CRISPR-associated endoribonuclease Cas6 n=1 Tax=Dolosicoccus paucivorans TaxID=84521 RepID=A0A1G8JUE5_9LACT|nr:CRISPR-associated endoribonuclease Cas6 [Dolosicoccus paucivorans]PMB85058.1 CRISPR-associated endoribonuclease Cas6 [Dolosicoccus paucivorans]PMC58986.1 CRISPR-associated endoribonuclease Cas6 [Dolosicoccus paucivorans]SDI34824.1 CRISPR-associated protein, Cas6 family [Dolosicoccus paucivorans]
MQKFIIKFIPLSDERIYANQLNAPLHGLLMEWLPPLIAQQLHETDVNPYSMSVNYCQNYFQWEINALTDEMSTIFSNILLCESLAQFELKSFNQMSCAIIERRAETLSPKELAHHFYQRPSNHLLDLTFNSPTAFKQQGQYVLFPDIRLIFQSLQNKYSSIFEEDPKDNLELLEEVENCVSIHRFNIQSSVIYVHGHGVPGFTGRVVLKLKGNDVLKSYVEMLASFGEYSGVGMKTSIGMGSIKINHRKESINE